MKKLAFLALGLLTIGGISVAAPRHAVAAGVVCAYFPPSKFDNWQAGWYYFSPEYPSQNLGRCTP